MKKFRFLCVFAVLTLLLTPTVKAAVDNPTGAINWYCRNNDTHTQPKLGSDLSVALGCGAIYVDTMHGDGCEDKVLYLTFDAGYENGNVEKIVDILDRHSIKGCFFILSNLISSNPDLVKKMADGGHAVCNHTTKHKDMTKLSPEAFEADLNALEKEYKELTGKDMVRLYRPPEGKFSVENLETAEKMGYRTVFWSFAYADWDNNRQMSEENAIKKVLDHTHNGAIILLHPTSSTNAAILERLITEWETEGYRFDTPDNIEL